jgi:outer membrane lipoprotein SlyB
MAGESHVVVGEAPGADAARRIFLALQRAGVDEDDIKLAGDAAVHAQHVAEDPEGKEQIDGAVIGRASRFVLADGIVGGIAGAVVGAVLGGIVVLIADGHWWWVLIPIAVLAVLGAVVGSFVGAERNLGVDDELELTLADVDGPMWVAVRVRDDDAARSVGDVLSHQGVAVVEEHTARARGLHLIEW